MADAQKGNTAGVAAAGGKNLNGGADDRTGHWDTDYPTIASLRARLQAINATTYSNAQLDKMTLNDMIYAVRVNDAPGTIKQ